MISYLKGRIILKKEKFIILEVGNVGYKVFLSQKTFAKILGQDQEIKLFCNLDVKETSLNLYGFLDYEEFEFFEILESIRGVGPKAALEISSLGPLEKIKGRILANDERLFEGISGIGKKKAMTIILELSGKIKDIPIFKKPKETDEAESALVSLGFSSQQAKEALDKVSKNVKESKRRIEQALKILGSKNT